MAASSHVKSFSIVVALIAALLGISPKFHLLRP